MTTSHTTYLVDAFTAHGSGGNPAAVVLDADNLQHDDRLRIAGLMGLSETAFVSRSETETIRLDFYTPTRQIAHCGHATIATFGLLRSLGIIGEGVFSKQTIDGPRGITITGDTVWMEQAAPRFEPIDTDAMQKAVAASLGQPGRINATVVDTGNRFALIEYPDRETLAAARPDMNAITDISEQLDLVGYYLFTRTEGAAGGIAATTRMFAPRYGIDEEAATGMAAGPLACLLHERYGLGPTIAIEQGAYMAAPSPSLIEVSLELRDGTIDRLFAGGRSRVRDGR